jgi:hypothetical protein
MVDSVEEARGYGRGEGCAGGEGVNSNTYAIARQDLGLLSSVECRLFRNELLRFISAICDFAQGYAFASTVSSTKRFV